MSKFPPRIEVKYEVYDYDGPWIIYGPRVPPGYALSLTTYLSVSEHKHLLEAAQAEAKAQVHEEESRLWRHTVGDAQVGKETLIEYHDRKAAELRKGAK